MTACGDTVATHTCARADATDMGARTDAMFSDMSVHPDTQYIYIRADGIG